MSTKNKLVLHGMAIDYLQSQKGRWPTIADETGLGYEWIKAMANDEWSDPGVNKIEALLVYAGLLDVDS